METTNSAGDAVPRECHLIEVRVAELRQLFNAIDPSPFRERDLDPRAEEFIVDWARDLPRDAAIALVVHLDRPAGRSDEPASLSDAIHEFFGQRATSSRRRLRELFKRGRTSLVIALAFLAGSIAVGDAIAVSFEQSRLAQIFREGLLIGGWVAMWRPLEVFLYDWWPIRAEARLFDRLGTMPVRIDYTNTVPLDPSRSDWPAARKPQTPGGTMADPYATGGFIPYPTNRVVGTMASAADARAAFEELLDAGFPREDIDVLHGEDALRRLDPSGADHGFLAQFQRSLLRTAAQAEEFKSLKHHVEDVRMGRFVMMVLAKQRDKRETAADILGAHGAEFVGFYGRWAWQSLEHRGPGRADVVGDGPAQPTYEVELDGIVTRLRIDLEKGTAQGIVTSPDGSVRNTTGRVRKLE